MVTYCNMVIYYLTECVYTVAMKYHIHYFPFMYKHVCNRARARIALFPSTFLFMIAYLGRYLGLDELFDHDALEYV